MYNIIEINFHKLFSAKFGLFWPILDKEKKANGEFVFNSIFMRAGNNSGINY